MIVEGVATAKRAQKPTGQTMQGGIIDKDMPIDVSNVMIVCPDCGPTKIGSESTTMAASTAYAASAGEIWNEAPAQREVRQRDSPPS